MRTKFSGILTLLLALVVQLTFAQEKTISGTITDDAGLPLPGVNIIVQGTNTGTQSDFDGNYTITANVGQTLVFSYVGFTDFTSTITASTATLDVAMQAGTELEEIVVTGVASGTIKKKVGVAVNVVKAEDLQDAGATTLDQALQGKLAGAVIQSTSGTPGQQANIVLRAIGSLFNSQPMILIDGIEIVSTSVSIGGGNFSSRLSDIDFSNVERVETIAGAAAGTIYGAQGANGVINIITKKGKAGKPKVSIRSNVGFVNAITGSGLKKSRFHRYQTNAAGFLTDLAGDRVIDLNDESQYRAVQINDIDVNGTLLGSLGINNTPFIEPLFDGSDILFGSAFNSVFGATVSGGSETVNYLISGNRTESEGTLAEGKYTKYDARIKVGFDLSDKLTIDTRLDFISSKNDSGTGSQGLINSVFQNLPHVDLRGVRNADGDLVAVPDLTDPNSSNPFYTRNITTRFDAIKRTMANININYDPWDFLNINVKYGFDTYNQEVTFFSENQTNHQQATQISTNLTGIINLTQRDVFFQNLLVSANLNLNFRDHFGWDTDLTSTTTVTFDWRDSDSKATFLRGTDNPVGGFGSFNINQSNSRTFLGFNSSPFRTYGVLVNQKFDFGSLWGFSAGFRTDFSNRFGNDLDFTFPRFNAYFNIADVLDSDTLRLFKLRAAFGEAGTQPPFGSNLITLSSDTLGSDTGLFFGNEISNEALNVETTKELEVGIDYGLNLGSGRWLSRVDGSFNFFDRESNGVIFLRETAPSTGASGITDNAYSITSDGVEFSLDARVFKSDKFKWNFGFRFSNGKSILSNIKSGQPLVIGSNFTLEEGQEIGTFAAKKILTSFDEVDLDGNRIIPADQVNNFTIASSGYVVDKNSGNVVLTPNKRVLGSSQPDFVMTFINDFEFDDFISLSFQVDWFEGLDKYNNAKQWLFNNGIHEETSVPVTIEDPSGVAQTGAFVAYYTSIYNTNEPTSHFIEDASFIRFRSISLNFKLNKIFKFESVDNINLTLTGRNLITITDYDGLDPEAAQTFGTTFQRGFDEFTVPNNKSFNVSLNINF